MNKKLKLLLAMLTVTTALGIASACSDSAASSSSAPESSSSSPAANESYTVKFVNADNSVISEKEYEEGTMPEAPAAPTYTEDHYTYTFTGWDKEVKAVDGDVVYKAQYTKTAIEYTVTFKADGVTVGEPLKYTMDTPTVTPPSIPAKDNCDGSWEAYQLNGGNKVVNAVYTPTEYTVTFVHPKTGMPVCAPMTYTVQDKDNFVFPEIPEEYKMKGYTVAWDKTNEDLQSGGLVVSFTVMANTYEITYNTNGGSLSVNTTQSIVYDDEYELAIPTPAKIYQEFLGWQDEEGNTWTMEGTWTIDSDVTLTARYSNVITFDSMTEVPFYLQNGGRASLAIVDGNGGKVLQATSENNDQGNVRIMMPLEYMAQFFEDESVQYMAFDLKLPEGATTPVSSIMYHNFEQSNYSSYETTQFDAAPTDAFKSYYLPREVYETWVENGKTEGRFLNVQAGITYGASYWIDNIRAVTEAEYMADLFSFETGSLRKNMDDGPGFCSPNYNQFHWKITGAEASTAKFTNEIVSDGMRAIQFTKKAGDSVIMFNQNADTSMELAMRTAGYVSFDLYVPEGSDAKIVRAGQSWYGTLKQGWNTVYEQVSATDNELIRFTDTTASTYVIDNFRLLTEEEYNAARFGFEVGGVIRDNNSETTNAGWSYYYVGWDKANNKASLQVNEGNGANDMDTLSNVRFATEQVHGGDYSLAFDKKAGYMSLGMSNESAMYASLKNGFTFWIYSTVEMNGESDTQFINGLNGKLNGGNGVIIPANTWTKITVSAEDIHSTGRFLILQGETEGTVYLDDFQPLSANE